MVAEDPSQCQVRPHSVKSKDQDPGTAAMAESVISSKLRVRIINMYFGKLIMILFPLESHQRVCREAQGGPI